MDLESGEGCETFTMQGLCPAEGKTAFAHNGKLYSARADGALPSGEEAKFVLPDTDFGMAGNKTLTALRFQGDGAFTLTISDGKRTKTQTVTMRNGVARARLSMRGNTFAIAFKLMQGAKIRGMTAELQTLG